MDATTDVADLVRLGMTQYEAAAYVGLLGREQATPTLVARVSGLPRQRAYDVLATLAERGLVTPVPGKGVAYAARPPAEVLDRLVALRRARLEQQQQLAEDLARRLGPLYDRGRAEAGPLDFVEVIHDGAHAGQRIGQLVTGAREDVVGMVRPPYQAPPRPSEAQVSRTAKQQRVLYERSLLEQPHLNELVRAYAALGEEVRITSELPMKMAVIDRTTAALSLPDPVGDPQRATTLIVHHPMLAATLLLAFESLWVTATPLEQALPELSGPGS